MQVEKITRPYELLIRFDENGDVKARHVKNLEITRYVDSLEVVASKELDAETLSDADTQAAFGAANAALLKEVTTEKSERLDLKAKLGLAKEELVLANKKIKDFEKIIAKIAALTVQEAEIV